MVKTQLQPEDLAARVAARVCHDIMSPVTAIKAGMSFLGDTDTPESRAEGRGLLGAGLQGLEERMALYRVALGRGEAVQETSALAILAASHFAELRPRLEWAIAAPALPGAAARATLHLAIILGETLASGGEARIAAVSAASHMVIRAEGSSPRARLHPDTRAGLLGGPCPEGPGGRWAFAAFLRSQVENAGGEIVVEEDNEWVRVSVNLPATPGQA
jgi:histidine phosphotransferase ChpT